MFERSQIATTCHNRPNVERVQGPDSQALMGMGLGMTDCMKAILHCIKDRRSVPDLPLGSVTRPPVLRTTSAWPGSMSRMCAGSTRPSIFVPTKTLYLGTGVLGY